jgi:hypothetical protein
MQDKKYKEVNYKNFLHDRKVLDIRSPESKRANSDGHKLPDNQTTPRGPNKDPLDRPTGDFRI